MPLIDAKGKQIFVDYSKFGVIHVGLDSPSYAQSNFDVNPKTPIILFVNGRVAQKDIADKFSLKNTISKESFPVTVTIVDRTEEDSGDYSWKWEQEWVQKVMFTPINPLAPATRYEIRVASGLSSEDKQTFSPLDFVYEFMTADEPGLQSTNVPDTGVFTDGDNIKIIFKSPMNTKDLENKIRLGPFDVAFKIINNDKILVIENVFTKDTNYTLTIPADTKDIYGRELGESVDLKFIYR